MWLEILQSIVNICLVPILGVLTKYAIEFINEKIAALQEASQNELVDKYLARLDDLIVQCVNATTQTYVQALKDKNMFDLEAQKTAFQMTYNAVKELMTDEASIVLADALSDVDAYIQQKIESAVKLSK